MRITIPIIVCFFISTLLKAQGDSILLPSSLRQDTLNKVAYYNRGLSFYNSRQFSKAIARFDSCLTIDSLFTEGMFMKALALQKGGNLKEATGLFETIKKLHPDYDSLDKRIKSYYLTVYISKNWYYMLAMLFVAILLIMIVTKLVPHKNA